MQTVNVLIAVDSDKLANQVGDGKLSAGTMQNPTALGSWQQSDVFISMIAQNSFATNDKGGSELTIKANSGAVVQWSITTFDSNINHTTYLYDGNFNPSTAINDIDYDGMNVINYYPSENNPTGPLNKVNNYQFLTSGRLLTPGASIQYTLSFALIDNATGNPIGYFSWDPFIQVNG